MKKLFSVLFCLCVFLSIPCTVFAAGKPLDCIVWEDTADESEEDRLKQIFIYKPQGYTTKKQYDVLYVLEGLYSTDNEALTEEAIADLEDLFAIGYEEILVVVIPHSVYRDIPFSDIVKRVDETCSTNRESSGRIVAGFSNGAYYIWNTIFSKPSYYVLADTYIPMSPIGAKKMMSGNFKKITEESDRIIIYNTCGNEGVESDYRGLYSGVEQMEAILENGKEYGYLENQNIFCYEAEGGHNWKMCYNALAWVLPRVLKKTVKEEQSSFLLLEISKTS